MELIKELEAVKSNTDNSFNNHLHDYLAIEDILLLPTLTIKGILFEYYTSTNNYVSHKNINE